MSKLHACHALQNWSKMRESGFWKSSLSFLSSQDRYRLFILASVGACMAAIC